MLVLSWGGDMPLTSLLIFVVILVAAFYLVRFIPDATLQTIVKVIIVVGAVLWIIRNLQGLLHCCSGS